MSACTLLANAPGSTGVSVLVSSSAAGTSSSPCSPSWHERQAVLSRPGGAASSAATAPLATLTAIQNNPTTKHIASLLRTMSLSPVPQVLRNRVRSATPSHAQTGADRTSVVAGKSVSERSDLGGLRGLKKKK